jgi:hypothetical protein
MRPQVRERILMLAPLLIALDRSRDGIQKILIAKRLGEEIDGAGLHRAHRHGNIVPVINTMGIRTFTMRRLAWKSTPLTPGSRTSRTSQLGTFGAPSAGTPAARQRLRLATVPTEKASQAPDASTRRRLLQRRSAGPCFQRLSLTNCAASPCRPTDRPWSRLMAISPRTMPASRCTRGVCSRTSCLEWILVILLAGWRRDSRRSCRRPLNRSAPCRPCASSRPRRAIAPPIAPAA